MLKKGQQVLMQKSNFDHEKFTFVLELIETKLGSL